MVALAWHPQARAEWLPPPVHLAEPNAERGLCGARIQPEPEPRPQEIRCCTRCWVLADIAGQKVPQQFSHAKRSEDEAAGQGDLL